MVWNHIEVEPALTCGITEQMFSYILPSSPYSFWRVPRTSLDFSGNYLVPYCHFITFTELDSSPSIWIFPLPQIYVHPTKTVFSALIIWYRFIWHIFLSDHPSMIFFLCVYHMQTQAWHLRIIVIVSWVVCLYLLHLSIIFNHDHQ